MSDADRLKRKKAARKRRDSKPVMMMCSGLGDKFPTTPEGKAAIQDIADAAGRIADRMMIKAIERAPKRGKWTLCISCDAIAAGHVMGPCGKCGSTSTSRFKDGQPVARRRFKCVSPDAPMPDEISAPSGGEPGAQAAAPDAAHAGQCFDMDGGGCGDDHERAPKKPATKRARGETDPNLPW